MPGLKGGTGIARLGLGINTGIGGAGIGGAGIPTRNPGRKVARGDETVTRTAAGARAEGEPYTTILPSAVYP